MASVSLYNSIFTEKVGPPQRHSSSAFIAHLLLQEYPPKVQPRSSSTRDHSLYDTLDKVDAEASCILIALANHDKKKDMNDLIPYSIRVIDYNQLSEESPISAESSVSGSSSCTDGNNDHSNNNCNNSNNSNNSNNKNMNDEISHQDIPKSLDDVNNNRSMSIKNLLGMNSSNDIPASSTSETPSMYGDTNKPLKIQLTSNKSNIPSPSKQQKDEEQANDQPKESSWKRKPKSDPILLLAEAAKAIDRDEQLQNQLTQKRKYSGDDNLNHRSIRPRHPMRDDQILQNEKSKFSYQYLSMKQNPKIKRNAMHAYITYMIYTDLASSDKSYYSQPDKSTHHQPNGSIFLPPSSSSQLSTPTSQHEFNSSPPFPPPSHHQHHYQHQQNNNNLEHGVEPYSRGKGYSSSTTTTPTVAAAIAAAAPTPPDNWHYGLSNSTPSPSLQHRRDIKLEANGNGNNNSSIMMARPLTAFLRDDLYT